MATKSLVRPGEMFPGFFDDFFKPWNEWFNGGRSLTVPAVNISETNGEYKVSVAAPGLTKNDFDIRIEGHVLRINLHHVIEYTLLHKAESGDYGRLRSLVGLLY